MAFGNENKENRRREGEKLMNSIERKKSAIKEIVELGKKKGSITNQEILDITEEIDFDAEQMEKLFETLETCGIEIVGGVEDTEIAGIDFDEDTSIDLTLTAE